MRKYQTLYWNW